MKTLANKINKLDSIDKTGLAIGLFFLLPSITLLIIDVIKNGAQML